MTGSTNEWQDTFVEALIAYCLEQRVFGFNENFGFFRIVELEEEIKAKTREKHNEKDCENEDIEEFVLDGQ